jgi:hypothetical protein
VLHIGENLNTSNPLVADITHVLLDCNGYNHNAAQNQHHLESNVPKIVAAKDYSQYGSVSIFGSRRSPQPPLKKGGFSSYLYPLKKGV